jgi:hypothetical protein
MPCCIIMTSWLRHWRRSGWYGCAIELPSSGQRTASKSNQASIVTIINFVLKTDEPKTPSGFTTGRHPAENSHERLKASVSVITHWVVNFALLVTDKSDQILRVWHNRYLLPSYPCITEADAM